MKLFIKVTLAAVIISASVCVSTPSAHAATPSAPFSDTFDTYQPGSLYTQGGWQNYKHVFNVTTKGCSSGSCITLNGLADANWKSGTPLTTGEWHIRFKFDTSSRAPSPIF